MPTHFGVDFSSIAKIADIIPPGILVAIPLLSKIFGILKPPPQRNLLLVIEKN
jgi:hypothetical protein